MPHYVPWLIACALILSVVALARAHRRPRRPQVDTEAFRKFVRQMDEAKKRRELE